MDCSDDKITNKMGREIHPLEVYELYKICKSIRLIGNKLGINDVQVLDLKDKANKYYREN